MKKALSVMLILITLILCFCVSPLAYQADESPVVTESSGIIPTELPESYGLNGLSEINGIEIPYEYDERDVDVASPASVNGTYVKNKYASTRGYDDLSKRANSEGCRLLYQAMAADSSDFDTSVTRTGKETKLKNGSIFYITKTYNLSNYGSAPVSLDDAKITFALFRQDNPQFFWISGTILFGSDTAGNEYLYLTVDSLYSSPSARAAERKIIYAGITEYENAVKGMTSPYDIAITIHDKIAKAVNYAYNSSGNPEASLWAHSIIGVFEKKGVVCEGYAKTFQLLLNDFGVENAYVVGYADPDSPSTSGHAWNMVKLDDGKWYWVDLTWNDRPYSENGIIYTYFGMKDSEFQKQHVPYSYTNNNGNVLNSLYALPTADGIYQGEINIYKENENIAKRFNTDDGFAAVQDKTAVYTLDFYSIPNDGRYFYISAGELPEAEKIIFSGNLISYEGGRLWWTYLYITGDIYTNSNIELKNINLDKHSTQSLVTIYLRSNRFILAGTTNTIYLKVRLLGDTSSSLNDTSESLSCILGPVGVGLNPDAAKISGGYSVINCIAKRPSAPTVASVNGNTITLAETDGYMYKMNNGSWQSSPVFTMTTFGNTYKFYQKAPATATLFESEPSPALAYNYNILRSAPDNLSVNKKTDVSVELKNISNCEYKIGVDGAWQTSPLFTSLNPDTEYVFYARYRKNQIQEASEISAPLTVRTKKAGPAAPSAPKVLTVGVNYIYFVSVDGCEYGFASDSDINAIIWRDTNVTSFIDGGAKYWLYLRYKETEDTMYSAASAATVIYSLAEAPSSPAYQITDATTVTLDPGVTGTTVYQYRMNEGEWQASNTFAGLAPGTSYRFSRRTVNGEIISAASSHITVLLPKLAGKAPVTPSIASKTDTTVTLTSVEDFEYKCDDGVWQSSPVFTELTGGTKYTFYQRYAENATHNAGETSQGIEVTTDKSLSAKPSAPTAKSVLDTRVILTPFEGYEYRCGTGEWQTSNEFSGLSKETEYIFYQRVAEGTTHFESEQSDGLTVTTMKVASITTLKKDESILVIDNENNRLGGVTAGTNVAAFLQNFNGAEAFTIINDSGADITDKADKFIGTGTKIQIKAGDIVVEEKTVVVRGDVNGDGKITIVDCMKLRAKQLGKSSDLQSIYLEAGIIIIPDAKSLTVVHYMKLRALQLGKIDSFD